VWQQPRMTGEAYLATGDRSLLETYLCQDGFLRLGRGYGVGVVAPGTRSAGGDFFWLRKSVDGSLMVLRTTGNVRPFDFFAPDKFTRVWYQFPVAPKPEGLAR
jgi:hypothetical protein